jgi:hypothetical protein
MKGTKALHAKIAHLQDQLDVQQVETVRQLQIASHKLEICKADNEGKDVRIFMLEQEVQAERIQRVAAQRGLVRYMKEHGLGHRIGYDPDEDAVVKKDIAEGRIAPLNSH